MTRCRYCGHARGPGELLELTDRATGQAWFCCRPTQRGSLCFARVGEGADRVAVALADAEAARRVDILRRELDRPHRPEVRSERDADRAGTDWPGRTTA